MSKTFILYTRPGCSLCDKTKTLLKEKGEVIREHNIDETPRVKETLVKELKVTTLPLIFIVGHDSPNYQNHEIFIEKSNFIGGYKDLVKYYEEQK